MAKSPADLAVMRKLGERVHSARDARDWSQEQLAEYAGINRSTVAKIEQCKGNPELLTINRIALALELSFNDFFPCRAER
jgi:transcriptional regulator with XRE-family HTH domain